MSAAAQPHLELGRVYRTRELSRWGGNPTRLAKRLVKEGRLRQAGHGLFYAPIQSGFGAVPASETAIMEAFLGESPFLISGPPRWNQLGLGATALFAVALVYNTKRTGEFTFDRRRYLLRRVQFPPDPPDEWFVVDLVQHHDMAGVSLEELEGALTARLSAGTWDISLLRQMAEEYGTKATQGLVGRSIDAAG